MLCFPLSTIDLGKGVLKLGCRLDLASSVEGSVPFIMNLVPHRCLARSRVWQLLLDLPFHSGWAYPLFRVTSFVFRDRVL